jgi:hypothetical protein
MHSFILLDSFKPFLIIREIIETYAKENLGFHYQGKWPYCFLWDYTHLVSNGCLHKYLYRKNIKMALL